MLGKLHAFLSNADNFSLQIDLMSLVSLQSLLEIVLLIALKVNRLPVYLYGDKKNIFQ